MGCVKQKKLNFRRSYCVGIFHIMELHSPRISSHRGNIDVDNLATYVSFTLHVDNLSFVGFYKLHTIIFSVSNFQIIKWEMKISYFFHGKLWIMFPYAVLDSFLEQFNKEWEREKNSNFLQNLFVLSFTHQLLMLT